MKKKISYSIFLTLILFGTSFLDVSAQSTTPGLGIDSVQIDGRNVVESSCSQKIKEAQKSYEQGLLSNISNLLMPCMDGGFNKSEQLQSYRLIIMSYLFLDEQEAASKYMNDLLVYDPDYKPNPTLDPIEYVSLYNSFKVNPVISLGFLVGASYTSPNVVNSYGVGDIASSPAVYKAGISPQGAISIDVQLYKRLFLTADAFVAQKAFKSTGQVLAYSQYESAETQVNLDIPVTLKYLIGKKKLKFYVRGGLVLHDVLSASSQMSRTNTQTKVNEFVATTVDLTRQRNKINMSAVFGAGINYKLGYGYLVLDARYYWGLSNVVKSSERYNNDATDPKNNFVNQISSYGYIDNDLSLNSIQVSLGYMYTIYKVKKKKIKYALD